MVPSLEPRKSERSLAQSLTALNSSPRCTPCLKNAPLQSSCFKVLPEVPRATPLGPVLVMPCPRMGSWRAMVLTQEEPASRTFYVCTWAAFMWGPVHTPSEASPRPDVCKAPGAEAGFTPKRAENGGGGQNCSMS